MLLLLFLFLYALIIVFIERKKEKIMRENGVNVYSQYDIRYYKDMFMYNRFKKFIRESTLSPAEKFEYLSISVEYHRDYHHGRHQ